MHDPALDKLRRFFSEKIACHGPTPAGADFNSETAQTIRFGQFVRLLDLSTPFSMIDFGCGYGALIAYLLERGFPLRRYVGFDIAPEMIEAAHSLVPGGMEAKLTTEVEEIGTADFTIASGIFNMKFEVDATTWRHHIVQTLDTLARASVRGFAFNMLTIYSDQEKMRPDLYYGDPSWFFDHCKRRFSRNVALLHDYELYDWTMAVKLGGWNVRVP
ncbi:MAG: class SAM-dependent methyltransferase [Deltaproteobacteria bacterium]|nr:class SAM-dependent methyltransferase [Deltaproteobacteria bacterium]